MKFRVMFKDSDTLGDAIREAVEKELAQDMDESERDLLLEPGTAVVVKA